MLLIVYIAAAIILAGITVFFINTVALNLIWLLPLLTLGYTLVFLLLHGLILVLSVIFINTEKEFKGSGRLYRKFITATLDLLFFALNIHIHATGTEKVPKNARFLIVSNHTYDFDPAVFLYILKNSDLAFIGKKEIYSDMVFISKVMHRLHCLPIDRENNRKAVVTINKAAELIKSDTASVAIFPEGYVSLTGELLPFRNGAFKIAKKACCPVVIATLTDTRIILKNLFRRRTDIYFDILDVIAAGDVNKLTTAEIGERAYELIDKNMKRK